MRWPETSKRFLRALLFAALPVGALSVGAGSVARGEEVAPSAQDAALRAPVERVYEVLAGIVPEASELGYARRLERLQPVVEGSYDLPFMATKSLGRHWAGLSEAERTRFVDAFSRLTVATYADRFDASGDMRFEILGSEPSAQGTHLIRTRIVGAESEPVQLDYRVRERDGGWRIIDVFLNGTVSELAVRRSEYSEVIKRDGLPALLGALDGKIAAAEADPPSPSP